MPTPPTTPPSQQVGIWDASVSIPSNIASDENGQLFYPSGYGFTYPNPLVSTGGAHAKTYPCGEATMQFMSLGNAKLASGLYVGAADHTGSGKLLQFSSPNGHQRSIHGKAAWRKEELDSVRTIKWVAKMEKHVESFGSSSSASSAASSASAGALSVVIYAPDSGVPLAASSSWTSPYALTIGVVPRVDAVSGRPLWAQSAEIYRGWALSEADWTRMGPITSAHRVGEYPEWYLRTDMWLNTHWQCHDIFNRTGGDPAFVAVNTGPVVDKLRTPAAQLDGTQSPIALHWYEWQQGPNPAEEDRYLFDTHYPDYFPSRTSFQEAVQALKEDKNVYTFPYINGRISDINSNAYLSENAAQYCTKQAPAALVTAGTTLTPYRETYGSNATFCVTNPFTSYWQNKIADTCKQLVQDYDVAGVYIDQIGSATQKFCWDSAHSHALGGGDWWVKGYDAMMEAVNAAVATVSGGHSNYRPMVTEDNAEPYMSMVQGLLSLNAFKAWYLDNNADIASSDNSKTGTPTQPQAQSHRQNLRADMNVQRIATTTGAHVSPAYPFVYGGYYVGFGAIWSRADFDDHNYFAAKLSTMLVTGTQLGWFSIAGRSDDAEDGCGPMGVGDLFLEEAHADTVKFVQTASATRAAVRDYFNNGHLTNPPALSPSPQKLTYVSQFDGAYSEYSSLLWQAWTKQSNPRDRATATVSVVFASTTESAYEGSMSVDPSLWFGNSHAIFTVSVRQFKDGVLLGHQESSLEVEAGATSVNVPVSVPARGTLVLEFSRQ